MRKILFHGKRTDNGEWVEGYFNGKHIVVWQSKEVADYPQNRIISIQSMNEVIPETVGQYTGLTDKNGKKIFEGDIIHYLYTPGEGFWNADEICKVKFETTGFYIECIHNNRFAQYSGWLIQIPYGKDKSGNVGEFEVIGNIHDNPELLESEV